MKEECDRCEGKFKIRAMGFRELAQLYNPNITSQSASNMLRRWIVRNKSSQQELLHYGYKNNLKLLSPIQVKVIVDHLGCP